MELREERGHQWDTERDSVLRGEEKTTGRESEEEGGMVVSSGCKKKTTRKKVHERDEWLGPRDGKERRVMGN